MRDASFAVIREIGVETGGSNIQFSVDPKTGRIGLKVEMIVASLVDAGRGQKLGKIQLSTATSTHLFEYISIENPFLILANIPPDVAMPIATYKKPRKDWNDEERAKFEREHAYWEVDVRRGVGEATGVALCVVRPMFREWAFRLTVKFDDKTFNTQALKNLVTGAGSSCGLGSFRPQKKGQFGRFGVMDYSEVEVKEEKLPPIKLYDMTELAAAGE